MLETGLILLDRIRRPLWGGCVLALLAAAWFVGRLEVLDSPERWTPRTTLDAWQQFERHFDAGDNVIVGLHFRRAVADDDLPRLRNLRQQLAQIEGIKQVYDCSLVAEQIEGVPLTTLLDPANAQRYSLYASGLWDAPQPGEPGRTLLTICELEYSSDQDKAAVDAVNARRRRVARDIEALVAREQASPEWGRLANGEPAVKLHLASSIIVMHEMERRTRQIAFTFLPASIAIGLLTLLLGFRSWRALAIAIGGSGFAMLLVLGWLGATGGSLGVVTMAAPTLMSIVAIASTVHMAAYAADHGSTGVRFPRLRLIREVGVPGLGAAITTGVGFLMLRFNELGPMRDLGYQLFAGSLLAFLGVFVVSQVLPIRQVRRGEVLNSRNLRAFASRVIVRPRLVSFGAIALCAALVYVAWPRPAKESIGVHFDADPFAFFDESEPIAQALAHFSDRKFGVYQLDVVLVPKHAPPPKGLAPPTPDELADQAVVEAFCQRVRDRTDLGVSRVVCTREFEDRYQDFQRQLAEIRQRDGWLAYLAQLGRYTTSAAIFGRTFQAWHRDKAAAGAQRVTFLAHSRAEGFGPLVELVRRNLPSERFECFLTGSIAQNVNLAEGLSGGMLSGLACSLVIMAVLLGALFRSVRLTLIAAVPNFFPVLAIYGAMGLLKIPINCGSAMVLTIALGIALNDTIHFLLHYRRRTREEGCSTQDAVTDTIEHLGRPIVLTSLVHIAGFLIFLLTDFQPLYHFGILASATMILALVGDLVLLPNLLVVFDRAAVRPVHVQPECTEDEPATVLGTTSTAAEVQA